MIAAARFPLRSDPANNQLERLNALGQIWFFTGLLSMAQPHSPISATKRSRRAPALLPSLSRKAQYRAGSTSIRAVLSQMMLLFSWYSLAILVTHVSRLTFNFV
ncbi:hypothetical protein CXB36_02595 [Pseudomonas syringae pv. syringae]|nr:hypothetical protein BKC06_019685 [Pseudomonas syringae pv. syringae]POP68672.1 hypothetical protein CXB36_02595 [Pseudomonas syringae pv. syringae]